MKKKDGTLACTSTPGENPWFKPRKRKLSPMKVQNINFTPTSKDKVKVESCPSKNATYTSTVNEDRFKQKLESQKSKAGWLLFFGKGEEQNLPKLHQQEFSFHDNVDLNDDKSKSFFKENFSNLNITEEESVTIEKMTRGQTTNKFWKEARGERLTSSNFGTVFSRKDDTKPDKLVRSIMYDDIDTIHMKWGRNHEPAARRAYGNFMVKKHTQFCLSLSGFIINTDHPHLGSSPDGLTVCQCCGEGLLEVKCPSSNKFKFKTPTECCEDKSFYCKLDENNNLSLKQNHKYYYQVQGQMGIANRNHCDFVVWTLKGFEVQRIEFDRKLWDKMVKKLNKFYLEAMMPEMYTSRVKRNIPLFK